MTRAPITAMAFYHPHGLVPAFQQASAFAGGTGTIATIPDILEARLRTERSDPAWSNYFTTLSSEYYGRTAAGTPVLVVAHGIGPMSTLQGIQEAYSYEYRDKTRSRRGGRITQLVFQQLINGEFGDVDVIDFEPLLRAHEYVFAPRTAEELLSQPLWIARLGGQDLAERYVRRHASMDLADLMENQNAVAQGKNPHPGKIMRMADSNNASYVSWRSDNNQRSGYVTVPADVEDGLAYAHLLSIGQLCHSSTPGEGIRTHLQSDISPHDWTDGVRLCAFRGEPRGGINGGFNSDRAFMKSRDLLWRPDSGEVDSVDGFSALVRLGTDWFTQYPKVGVATDTGQPQHAVRAIEHIGDPRKVLVEFAGYHQFVRFSLADMRRNAPEGANAYTILGAELTGEGHLLTVQFSRISVDRTRRLLTTDDIYRDVNLVVRLAAAAA